MRYSAVAIVLHWAIAAAIIANLALGWWMHGAIEAPATQARAVVAFQLHKSLGLSVLGLSVLRLLWRLRHRAPPLPAGMPAWERLAARATHGTFYALMIGVPLSGWLYVSTQWRGSAPLNVPTLWFGLWEVPHLLGLNELARDARAVWAGRVVEVHQWLAWSSGALLVLHVAAALKHHLVNRDEVLAQMLPLLRKRAGSAAPTDGRRRAILMLGSAGIVIASAAFAAALLKPVSTAPTSNAAASPAVGGAPGVTSAPGGWVLDPARSEIAFSGTHAGVAFRGRFTRWSAALHIDPHDLTRSRIAATIDTASATDGVTLHDETLPETEWFDTASHPSAAFQVTHIRARDAQRYALDGQLKLKARALAITGLILEVKDDQAQISGRVVIDRRDADLGMESDPDAQWVSREIVVEIRLSAHRAR